MNGYFSFGAGISGDRLVKEVKNMKEVKEEI
jgi:hypothetical protein